MAAKILTTAMQKGGTGKTTVAVNLAGALAGYHGLCVTLVDMDPQRNATLNLIGQDEPESGTIWEALSVPKYLEEVRIPVPGRERMFLVPGSRKFAQIEKQVPNDRRDHFVYEIKRLMPRAAPEDTDLVIIDTGPTEGIFVEGALAASDGALIIVKPEYFSTVGIQDAVESVRRVRRTYNAELSLVGIVINQTRPHTNEHGSYLEQYQGRYGKYVIEPLIPQRVILSHAQRAMTPIEYYSGGGGTGGEVRQIFRKLAENVSERMELTPRGASPGDSPATPVAAEDELQAKE